jgi:hypothetical protein
MSGSFGKNVRYFDVRLQQLIVLLQMEQIVTKIDNHIPVLGQHLDCFAADFGRCLIVALETQIPLLLAKDLRLLISISL